MVTTQDHQLIIWINLSLSKSYGTKLFRYKTWPDIFFIDKHDQQAFLRHHQCFFRTRTRRHAHFDQYECQCLSFKRALATLFFRACVARLLFFTRCDGFCDLLQYTHTEKWNLFVLYNKNSNSLLKDFGAWKWKTSTLTLF